MTFRDEARRRQRERERTSMMSVSFGIELTKVRFRLSKLSTSNGILRILRQRSTSFLNVVEGGRVGGLLLSDCEQEHR
jgi:hypothetical protein